MTMTTVWVEIPVRDLDQATEFYNTVFGWDMVPMMMGPERVAAFGRDGVGGNLTTSGTPGQGQGNVIYLEVPDSLEVAAERAMAAGATGQEGPVSLPKGAYITLLDPDGNRIGLFKTA
ncbi:VOC family protein [Pseudooceanicola sp. C21-150M6]|uniref:VOC family protein n=1 Tax=Pseudooceanicola sp. C21-150M6 TaxID=3434355 RepID=UPI003D7F5FCB